MANPCAWLIDLGEQQPALQLAAAALRRYGLAVQGQRWPQEAQAWLASAQEAAQAGAAVTVVAGSTAQLADPAVRRSLALFRLSLQTRSKRTVNGFTLSTEARAEGGSEKDATADDATCRVLADWAPLAGTTWPAKVVARAHAPVAPKWPVRLDLHAHERLGVWLETHPAPGATADGALLGVAGNEAAIDFHAVGPAGQLPERTDNEYELRGLEFTAAGHAFKAWAVRNTLPPDQSYYVRLNGEPDFLAIGALPAGEPDDVHLIALG